MKANASPMSVADYCEGLNKQKIIVNKDYQRNEGLWSSRARSYFIESILLEYPIPKLYLYAKLDLKTRQTIKEIVDGQQRSHALLFFFNNKLRLSSKLETEEVRGKKYNQLDDEWKTRFLSYSLPIDQFSGISEDEVQEAFRRMNSSNVPLNDEEQRNARFQGPFKWFIIKIAKEYRSFFTSINLFSKRDGIRMSDLKTYAEIVHVLENEKFVTIKGKQIDDLYKKFNSSFEKEDSYYDKLSYGLNKFIEMPELHQPEFLRPHVFQSIILAFIAHHFSSERFITSTFESPDATFLNQIDTPFDLELLHQCLSNPEDFPEMQNFIDACTRKTNTAETKTIRFLFFYQALQQI